MSDTDTPVPTPGSPQARASGCCCPIQENNGGRWPSWRGGWVVLSSCPVHYGTRVNVDWDRIAGESKARLWET